MMPEPHRAPPIENPQVAVVIFVLISLMMVQCIYAVYGPGADKIGVYLFPINFALLLGASIYLRAITRLSKLVLIDDKLYKKGWNSSELIPDEHISLVVLDRRYHGRRKRSASYQVVVLLKTGERLIVSESRNYFSSRKKAEQFARWLHRPHYDETLNLTRQWEELDEPFYSLLMKEGRKPVLPEPPRDESVTVEVGPQRDQARLRLPPESTWSQIGSVFVVVILVGAGVGYSFFEGAGSLIGSGFFIALCAAALPDARASTSERIVDINSEGFQISWKESDDSFRRRLQFPKPELEGLWAEEEALHLLTDDTHEEVLFPHAEWAHYVQECTFFIFAETDKQAPETSALGDSSELGISS